ncbi:hypothetical protein D3C87_730800 [compost metagenome]
MPGNDVSTRSETIQAVTVSPSVTVYVGCDAFAANGPSVIMDRLPSIYNEIIFTNLLSLFCADLCDFAKTNSLTFILSSRKTS